MGLRLGPENPPVIFAPPLTALLSQQSRQFGIVAGAAELDLIDLGHLIEFQEFLISFDPGRILPGRQNASDIGSNPEGTKMPQHTDPLISLFYIEISQILTTGDRIPDSLITQMVCAEADPFGGKFTFLCERIVFSFFSIA